MRSGFQFSPMLVTFHDDSMTQSARLCVSSAEKHGTNHELIWTPYAIKQTEFYQQNKPLLDQPRGSMGFWSWKPFIIDSEMAGLSDNDILIYADAGVEFIDDVWHIIDRMDQDIFLFGNQWEHAHWCKRDIVEAIMPNAPWQAFGKQVQASVIFFRVNDKTRQFVKEWLDWCLTRSGHHRPGACDKCDGAGAAIGYLIDDSPSLTFNHPEFQENRHDQAILTTMAYRDGIRLHWWPAMYNDGAFVYERGSYPDEGYPVLVHHHRRRNAEWDGVAA